LYLDTAFDWYFGTDPITYRSPVSCIGTDPISYPCPVSHNGA
jgi:hypothetical protein